jgi:hypothetical protein
LIKIIINQPLLSVHENYSATCGIDAIYATYLNIVPLPNGNRLSENGTYYIACKNASTSRFTYRKLVFALFLNVIFPPLDFSELIILLRVITHHKISWYDCPRTIKIISFQYGETFVNKVYSVEGITEEAVYKTGAIEIKCQNNGTIYPAFFNETYDWCRREFLNEHLL